MNEIFNSNKLPERRLGVRKVIALNQQINTEQAAIMVKRNMAMQLATKMLEEKSFFKEFSEEIDGQTIVEYRADVVVLTSDEYAELKRESFKDGMRHAQGGLLAV